MIKIPMDHYFDGHDTKFRNLALHSDDTVQFRKICSNVALHSNETNISRMLFQRTTLHRKFQQAIFLRDMICLTEPLLAAAIPTASNSMTNAYLLICILLLKHSKAFTSSFPLTDFPCFLRVCCSRMEAQRFSTASLCFDVNLNTLSTACFTRISITVLHLKEEFQM